MSSQAGVIAQKALGSLWSATVAGASGLSDAFTKARKHYADYYEKEQLEALRKQGKPPAELLYAVMQRFYYLSMAGYNNELAAAARKIGTKLAEYEKSSIPLDMVIAAGRILTDASSKYGDFSRGSWLNLSDFLNTSRMGKDHYDRDGLVNDFYFAVLLLAENSGGVNEIFERALRDAAGRMVEGASFRTEATTYTPYSSSAYNLDALSGSLPSYAQPSSNLGSYGRVPSATAPPPSSSGNKTAASGEDTKTRAAKTLYVIASSIKKAADEAESRRQKSLRDAEDMLKREREGLPGYGSKPAATGIGSSSRSTSSTSYPSTNYSSSGW